MALILSLIQYNKDTAQTFFLKLSNFFSFQLFSFGSSSGNPTALDGAVMTGIACLVAFVLAIIICKPKLPETRSDTSRLLMQVGHHVYSQLLGALGSVFNEAGVGDVISSIISSVVPSGDVSGCRSDCLCIRYGHLYNDYGKCLCCFYSYYYWNWYSICY